MRSVRAVVLPSALLALCSLAGTAFAEPSVAERALVKRVQAQEQSSIALLEQIVNVNSGTMNFAGVRKVADMLRPHFEALGFKLRWEDGAAFGRAGHLIAEHPRCSPWLSPTVTRLQGSGASLNPLVQPRSLSSCASLRRC